MMIYYEIVVFILGLIIGSFLNSFIWRLYSNDTFSGRSYCPSCRKTIAWYDNIPILSFILLKGRCRQCHKKISWQYPLVELITAILFVLVWQLNVSSWNSLWFLLRGWLIVFTLVIVFVYDYRWKVVPIELITLSGIAIFILNLILGFQWFNLLFFAVLGAGFFLIQYLATRKKGVGEGDIWLGAFLGLAFPQFGSLLLIMFITYSLGSIIGLTLIAFHKKTRKSSLALGPFLATGAIIALIWGDKLISWYLSLLF
jgi:prepilin signal peptidase PulO-like enzyme (type II secretory pathway)